MATSSALRGKATAVRACTLLVVIPLLVACDAGAPDRDRADEPNTAAKVLDHELMYGTLWLSEADEPDQAAAEFLEEAFGWSTDPVRISPESGDDAGDELDIDDPERHFGHRIGFEAQSPDGRPVRLVVRAGEPTPPGAEPDPDDDRWRVVSAFVDPQPPPWWLSLDDGDSLEVHEIPDEQDHSVLLLYHDGEHEALLLDDGELEPGAEVDTLDLRALDITLEEQRSTGMVVHFDANGQVLERSGGRIIDDRRPDG